VETNLAWNLTEKGRFTQYNDSAEELGRLAGFQCFYFSLRAGVSPESSVQPLLFLSREKPKSDNSLKWLRIELRADLTIEKTTRQSGKPFLTWKIFIIFQVVVVGRFHYFTPSLLHFLLDIFGNQGRGSSQYEKAWNARGKI